MADAKAAPAKARPASKWDMEEEVYFPRIPGTREQPDVTVSVNGRDFRIQRGVHVMAPKPVADVARRMVEAQMAAEDFELGRATG